MADTYPTAGRQPSPRRCAIAPNRGRRGGTAPSSAAQRATTERRPGYAAFVLRVTVLELPATWGEPRLALAEYEKAIGKEPNRFRSLYGAARAAEAIRENGTAQKYYRQMLANANQPQGNHVETLHAKQYLARQ